MKPGSSGAMSPDNQAPATAPRRIVVSREAPPVFQAMLWEEFFSSRSRGISLQAHFPWLATPRDDTRYVLVSINGALVGGLALRAERVIHGVVGNIGLVCIHPDFRGRGLSKDLLEVAIDIARSDHFGALRLWTRKPGLYVGAGFQSIDSALFGTIAQPPVDSVQKLQPSGVVRRNSAACSIPPFALRAEVVEGVDGALTLVSDRHGPIVASWSGGDGSVAELMAQVLPATARMNAFIGQSLLPLLAQRRWSLDLAPSRLQMILPLDGRSAAEWESVSRVPVTGRI